MNKRGGTWSDCRGVRISLSRGILGPWRINVGGRCVFTTMSRKRAGEVYDAIADLITLAFANRRR